MRLRNANLFHLARRRKTLKRHLFFAFKTFDPGGVPVLEEPFRCRDVSVDGGLFTEVHGLEVVLFDASSVFIEHTEVELRVGQMLPFGFLEPFGGFLEILFNPLDRKSVV